MCENLFAITQWDEPNQRIKTGEIETSTSKTNLLKLVYIIVWVWFRSISGK